LSKVIRFNFIIFVNIIKTNMARKKKMKNPCWKGFIAYGLKTKGGKKVPNCVRKKKK